MTARLPPLAQNAITVLFERAINDTRLFWSQRADGSLCCVDWEWCCPEIPAILAGLDAVVFVTKAESTARLASPGVVIVSIEASRIWGKSKVVRRAPSGARAITWDDRLEVDI
jgi:hypothetical protein